MGLFHHILVYMGEGTPTFGPSCNEFVYPDNVLLNHGGLPHVIPLAVHLEYFLVDKYRGPLMFFLFEFCCETPPSC